MIQTPAWKVVEKMCFPFPFPHLAQAVGEGEGMGSCPDVIGRSRFVWAVLHFQNNGRLNHLNGVPHTGRHLQPPLSLFGTERNAPGFLPLGITVLRDSLFKKDFIQPSLEADNRFTGVGMTVDGHSRSRLQGVQDSLAGVSRCGAQVQCLAKAWMAARLLQQVRKHLSVEFHKCFKRRCSALSCAGLHATSMSLWIPWVGMGCIGFSLKNHLKVYLFFGEHVPKEGTSASDICKFRYFY